jgi:hypothetical protein
MSAVEVIFARKQTLPATTLDIVVAPISDLPGDSPKPPFALRLGRRHDRGDGALEWGLRNAG